MREILKFGLLLGLVCAISAGTLTAVYSVVSVKIEENNRLEAIRKRKTVLPEAATFEAVERNGREIHFGLDTEGAAVGTAMTVSQRGYAGPILMTVGIGLDSRLTGLAISKLDQSETPGLGVKITKPAFLDMFRGKDLSQIKLRHEGGEIDAITAATISSRAVVNGVQEGMKWYFRNFPEGPEGIEGEEPTPEVETPETTEEGGRD